MHTKVESMEEVRKIFEGKNKLYGQIMAAFAMIQQCGSEIDGSRVIEKYCAVLDGIFTSIKFFTGIELYYYFAKGCWVVATSDESGEVIIDEFDVYS